MTTATSRPRQTDKMVNIMITGGRITSSLRAAIFAEAGKTGLTMNQLALQALAEKLAADGYAFSGVFAPGDMSSKGLPDPFEGDQDRATLVIGDRFVTKAEKAAFDLHKPRGKTYQDWAVDLMREKVLANVRRVA